LPEAAQRALCVCLMNAKVKGLAIFQPMLEAIATFDAAQIPHWQWTQKIGAHERHLQRRSGNPLFSPARRTVTGADVFAARVRDADAYNEARDELEAIRLELRDEELPPAWFEYLNDKRERLVELRDRIADMGSAGRELRPLADKLKAHVVGIMRDTLASSNPKGAAAIDEAEALQSAREALFAADWSRHIQHPEKIITADEVVPALLSEDAESLETIVESMEQEPDMRESLTHARTGALDIVRRALAEGHQLPGVKGKLEILGVAL
jgi:hypothetical protein